VLLYTHDLLFVLRRCRVALFCIGVGAVALFTDQVQDLLLTLALTPLYSVQIISFFTTLTVWAIASWHFSKLLLSFNFSHHDTSDSGATSLRRSRLTRAIPRILGTVPYLLVAAALGYTPLAFIYSNRKTPEPRQFTGLSTPYGNMFYRLIAVSIGLAAAFYFYTRYRRRLAVALPRRMRSRARWQHVGMALADGVELNSELRYGSTTRALGDLSGRDKLTLALSYLSASVTLGVVTTKPALVGVLGALSLVLLAAPFWITLASAADYVGRRYRLPMFTLLFLAAVVFSIWNDNHAVRSLDNARVPDRVSVAEDFPRWWASLRESLPEAERRERQPIFLVAAEGGGIRAAYWTELF
jgi:hypothetical protein